MNTNLNQSTDKTHSAAVCRIITVLYSLFAFIWLPTPEVDAQTEFTVITGRVISDFDQAALVRVRVTVLGKHAPVNNIAETEFNGEYIVLALTTDSSGNPIPFPIEIRFTKEGFKPTTVILQESERQNGAISCDVLMRKDLPLSSSLQLISPPNCEPTDPVPCGPTDAVTVFRWTRSENPLVHSYRVIFSDNPRFEDPLFEGDDIPELPESNDEKIIAPQVALDLAPRPFSRDTAYYWRVVALNEFGEEVERSLETFSFFFLIDGRGFTVFAGLVKSDFNQLGLAGARVVVSSAQHVDTDNSDVETVFNGEYIVIALTTSKGNLIDFQLQITATKEGFRPIVIDEDDLPEKDIDDVITVDDLVMESIGDFDGDGIKDAAENASTCLNADDADTDDDGISDGEEDINFNGTRESNETDPCESDTDRDGIQDGTELGYTISVIDPDTDTAIFQPDLDPSTKTNPLDNDSDNDGLLDGEEDLNRNGRLDAGETDPSFLSAIVLPAILPLLIGE